MVVLLPLPVGVTLASIVKTVQPLGGTAETLVGRPGIRVTNPIGARLTSRG